MSYSKKFYIVRLRADDSIVACGTAKECAERMGMELSVFRTTASRCRRGLNSKYEIDVKPEDIELNE